MIFDFKSNQRVLLCPPHRATFVLHLLDPRTAIMTQTIAAVDSVQKASHSHVPLTQLLGPDTGRQHFALQTTVAVKVSEDVKSDPFLKTFLKDSLVHVHRFCHLTKLPQ